MRKGRAYGYLIFAMILLVMSWESSAAGTIMTSPAIPEESIRIRILAHSDSVEDQWVKRQVQRAVADEIRGWGLAVDSLEAARVRIADRLPELERRVNELLEHYYYTYRSQVELGQVQFPAKVYNKDVYPAGEYEALLITLGAGQGENWWCVLFPPLCLGAEVVKAKPAAAAKPVETESAGGDAKGAGGDAEETDEEARSTDGVAHGAGGDASSTEGIAINVGGKSEQGAVTSSDKVGQQERGAQLPEREGVIGSIGTEEIEVRFFLADIGKKLGEFIKGLF